ncbi:hypothetical protein RvY_02169 [Ramazzottius varieornatus]|uniref:Uncharacterized protein n=1 Tax=Ramazzottius varieornatus TaxID=947166 RepID=A0A1D1UM65_RAMVA|nr:hypothetical protein RvY_02169 [Ramazzottius varieornatus]
MLRHFLSRKIFHHILALLLIAIQAAVLNYFLISLNADADYGRYLYFWIAADIVVVVSFIASFYYGLRYGKAHEDDLKYSPTNPEQAKDPHHLPLRHLGVLPYGWLSWLVYSVVLVAKIVTCFKTFGSRLTSEHKIHVNFLEFTLGGTAAVFIAFLNGTCELSNYTQKHYLRWMQHYVLLELIDCVEFLTLLFSSVEFGPEEGVLPPALREVILVFACINIISPTLALYRVSARHNRHPERRNRFFLTQTLIGTLFGNIPYFIVRVYLWHAHNFLTGLFTMKNLIGIIQDSQELFEYMRELKENGGTDDTQLDTDDGSALKKMLRKETKRALPVFADAEKEDSRGSSQLKANLLEGPGLDARAQELRYIDIDP